MAHELQVVRADACHLLKSLAMCFLSRWWIPHLILVSYLAWSVIQILCILLCLAIVPKLFIMPCLSMAFLMMVYHTIFVIRLHVIICSTVYVPDSKDLYMLLLLAPAVQMCLLILFPGPSLLCPRTLGFLWSFSMNFVLHWAYIKMVVFWPFNGVRSTLWSV